MKTTRAESRGYCSDFCLCAIVDGSAEETKKIVDFIWSKMGKPKLPKESGKYFRPEATYKGRLEGYRFFAQLSVFYSKEEIERRADEVLASKNITQKAKDLVTKFKGEIPLQANNFGELVKVNHIYLKMSLEPISFLGKTEVSLDSVKKIQKENMDVSSLIKAVESLRITAKLTTCSTYRFDSKKSKLVGGLILPTQLPLSAETQMKIGNAQLHGFSFLDSKIGLEKLEISQEEKYLEIGTKGAFSLSDFQEFILKPFELSEEYSHLLIEDI
jgi:hypothetical protein